MKTKSGIWQWLLLVVLVAMSTSAGAQLKADFSVDRVSGCPPLVVVFKNNSKGDPASIKWDLGNGTLTSITDPVGTYFNPGTYTIKMIVKKDDQTDTLIRTQYITVNAPPTAAFGISDSTGCYPLKATFSDKSVPGSGAMKTWQWDFGDGTLSKEQNPGHTYTSGGNFNVTLRVTNTNECAAVITKTALVKIPSGVKADFTYASGKGCHTPTPVTFTNATVGNGDIKYKWDFGDGNTSTATNPVNSYGKDGGYTVKLIAENSFGCRDTIVKPNAINIGSVKADFTTPGTICEGNSITLKNSSAPPSFVSVFWSFGDGTTSLVNNPVKTFAQAGEYDVKLVTDFGVCKDSIVKSVKVISKVKTTFTATNNTGCGAPLTVSFTNKTDGAVASDWDFGDSTTSKSANPQHTYTKPGSFTVKLITTNAAGCTDTLVQENFVRILPPKIGDLSGAIFSGCLPATINPKVALADSSAISTYLWDFGDSTTSTEAFPSHTYTVPGKYTVRIAITTGPGCADTFAIADAVQVGNKPTSQFAGTPKDVCAFTPVNFTDQSTDAVVNRWYWDFGDGTTSNETNPLHMYNDTGYFNVQLIVYNFGCADTLKNFNYVHVRPPVARFDTSYICSDPLKRSFLNKSVGATSYAWSFGDGQSSADQAPVHLYAQAGNYDVSLKVSNGVCEHTSKKTVVVIDEHGKLETSDTVGCVNGRITFKVSNVNMANIATYSWYFNGFTGGAITTANNPVANAYSTSGTRQSIAIITDVLKCRDTLFNQYVIKTYGPKASFNSQVTGTCFGNTINFSDSTKTDGIHPVAYWKWSYGEGVPEQLASGPFSHNYTATGTYDVKLLVEDSYGCRDSIVKPGYINITRPVAQFQPSDTLICPSLPVRFNNTSQGVNAVYNWDFGDNTTAKDVVPSHAFPKPGIYPVKMWVTDKNGCKDSANTTIKVFTASAAFSISDSFSTCPPLVVDITNKSSNFISFNWAFGDGGNSALNNPSHIYTYPGTYDITLAVKNNGGCTDTVVKKVVINGPTGVLNYSPVEACNPADISFKLITKNTVNYIYDFSDGETDFSTKPVAQHRYSDAGLYLPKIILEDEFGCKVPITGLDTIKIKTVETHIKSSDRVLCDSGYIAFSDSTISNDYVSSFLWNFGDGSTSDTRTPNHIFKDTGFYSITLITRSGFGCTDTIVNKNYVKVVSSPEVKILGDTSVCEPGSFKFSADFIKKDTAALTFNWTFANGATVTGKKPDAQQFETAGTYPVTLVARNSYGCSNTVSRSAIVRPKPQVNAGADTTICRSARFRLAASGADSYKWISGTSLSCVNCATPMVKPDSVTTYRVEGKTVYGCTNMDSVTVNVQQRFKMTVENGDTICKGETIMLKAHGADKYSWSPSLWLDNPSTATAVSRADTSVIYTVTGRDNANCFADTGFVKVKVYPKPHVEILNGDNINMQVGSTVQLKTKSSYDVTTYRWTPSLGLSCMNCAEPKIAPRDNITYVVEATNAGACSAKDVVTVNVICDNANVYFPNTFSPNGDGENDYFYPRGNGLNNIRSFRIFNRWGQIVFQKNGINANNQSDGWDGKANGLSLPPDVYVYVLEVVCANNVVFPFKGNVTLLR